MDALFYKEYYELERSHWWFKARLQILESLVAKRIANGKPNLRILNVGVATGATTEMLSKFGIVTSVEYDAECCAFLKEKTGIEAINASLTELPFEDNSFDLITAFDVIEHIEDDALAAQEIARVLSKEGHYFVTVPAFMFLWSHHDVVNHHFRRYTKPQLVSLFSGGSLQRTSGGYFNFWLFPPIAITRFLLNLLPKKKTGNTTGSDNEVMSGNALINRILFNIFLSEKTLLKWRLNLPFGVSIYQIGKK